MLDRKSDAVIPEARCRAGSPMPRGERIAKPTGWGQPTWSVFVFVLQAEEQRASDAPAHTLRRIRRLVSHTRSDWARDHASLRSEALATLRPCSGRRSLPTGWLRQRRRHRYG